MIKFWSGKKKTDGDAVVIKIDCACGQLTYIPPKEIQAILRDNPMAREAMEGTFHALTNAFLPALLMDPPGTPKEEKGVGIAAVSIAVIGALEQFRVGQELLVGMMEVIIEKKGGHGPFPRR